LTRYLWLTALALAACELAEPHGSTSPPIAASHAGGTKLYFRDSLHGWTGLPISEQSSRTALVTWPGANTNRRLSVVKGSAEVEAKTDSSPANMLQDQFIRRYVSEPLAGAQTVGGGPLAYNIAFCHNSGFAKFIPNAITVYVWRPATQSLVGMVKDTVLTGVPCGTTYPLEELWHWTGIPTAAVTAASGDVVVVEIWARFTTLGTSGYYKDWIFYDGAVVTTDIYVPGTGGRQRVTDHASFVEFSEPLTFQVRVPDSIDATGATDVTVPLLDWIATVPDGSVIGFRPGGQYRIENSLIIKDRNNVTLDLNGATLFANTTGAGLPCDPLVCGSPGSWPQHRVHVMFYRGSNMAIRNGTIRGAHPTGGCGSDGYVVAYEAQHGVEFKGVTGGEASRLTITDVYGDFFILSPTGTLWNSNIRIHHDSLDRNGRQGIAVTGAQDVVIDSNSIRGVQRATFDVEPGTSSQGARRIAIRDNRVGCHRLNFFSNVGSGGAVSEDITVERNVVTGDEIQSVMQGGLAQRRARYVFRDNVGDVTFGSPHDLVVFIRIDSIVATGNRNPIQLNRNYGVRTSESCQVHVSGNDFPGAKGEWIDTLSSCP